jgi:hypothetical protein
MMFSFFLFLPQDSNYQLRIDLITEFEPSHGCHQKAHGQGRAAKGLDQSPSVLFLDAIAFSGRSQWRHRHDFSSFIRFFSLSHAHPRAHDHSTNVSCTYTFVLFYIALLHLYPELAAIS